MATPQEFESPILRESDLRRYRRAADRAALAGCRDDIVLATKAFVPMSDNPNHRGSSRRWIIRGPG